MTKKNRILLLLQERAGLGLTALESLQLAGTMRLAARVKDLRDDGYSIDTEIIETPGGDHVARYRLVPTADDGTPLNEVLADGIGQVMTRLAPRMGEDNAIQNQELARVPALQGTMPAVD